MTKTHNQLVLDHMIDIGPITQLIAGNYGVRRLASRISELKGEGVSIVKTLKKDAVGSKYVEYSLNSLSKWAEVSRRHQGRGWKYAS